MKKETLVSILIFIPLGAILAYINYIFVEGEPSLIGAILFGYIGALCVLIIPRFLRKKNNKE